MSKKFIWMLAAILLCGTMALISCSDNKDTPAPEPTPTPSEDLADYTLFIYGHADGYMDHIIDGVYEKVKPLLTDNKKVRVLVFYKYGHDVKDYPFSGKYANQDELLRFELTSNTNLENLRTEARFEEKSQFQLYSQDN